MFATPPSVFWQYFPVGDFVQRFNAAWAQAYALGSTGQVTSWWRSWWENIRVGGSVTPLSQHLGGLAADVAGGEAWRSAFRAAARQQGLTVVEYDDHDHVQFWSAGVFDQWLRAS